MAPGLGPPLHTHAAEDETLYVLEGGVRFRLGEELRTGGFGIVRFVPRGTRHTFRNVGTAPARMLIHFAPSGMERFFDAFGALLRTRARRLRAPGRPGAGWTSWDRRWAPSAAVVR